MGRERERDVAPEAGLDEERMRLVGRRERDCRQIAVSEGANG